MDSPVTKKEFNTAIHKLDTRIDQVADGLRHLGIEFEDMQSKMDQVLEILAPVAARVVPLEERVVTTKR